MKSRNRKLVWSASLVIGIAMIGAIAVMVSLTGLDGLIQAQGGTTTATLTVSPSTAQPGDTITVNGSGFRVGTEASFIYTSTITIGGVPIASVASVDAASGFLHAGRTTDGGTYIAEHIDIDPPNTTADGAFSAQFVLPYNAPNGDQELRVTSCWGGADESYPEDGVAPCGRVGLGGGVNDRVATATVTIDGPVLTISPATATHGETIMVRGSNFRVGEEASFIYASTITIGGKPLTKVDSVDLASGYLHAARPGVAEHIDIDPANTTPDGMFIAAFVLPSNLAAGDHDLEVTSCWGGADESYPEDGVTPCGEVGLGGGVNDRVATATVTIVDPEAALTVSPSMAEPGDTITVRGSGFRMGEEASFIYTSTITIGGVAIGKVANVDLASGYLHAARPGVAEHIDIDPANTTPDGVFVAEFVLPYNLTAGEHELKVTSCWGGADESYPENGVAPCGTVGLGGGVNDRVATATMTIE